MLSLLILTFQNFESSCINLETKWKKVLDFGWDLIKYREKLPSLMKTEKELQCLSVNWITDNRIRNCWPFYTMTHNTKHVD